MTEFSPAIAEFKALHGIDAKTTPILDNTLNSIPSYCEETNKKILKNIEGGIDNYISADKHFSNDPDSSDAKGFSRVLSSLVNDVITEKGIKERVGNARIAA